MVYLLIEAGCDGDYIPHNGLSTKEFVNVQEVATELYKRIEYFLSQNCLLNSYSGEMQLTDFYWDDPDVVEEPSGVESTEAFMDKVQKIIRTIEGILSNETQMKEETFKVYTDDDTRIVLKWSRTPPREGIRKLTYNSLYIEYNQAPNGNKWSHVNYEIITIPN